MPASVTCSPTDIDYDITLETFQGLGVLVHLGTCGIPGKAAEIYTLEPTLISTLSPSSPLHSSCVTCYVYSLGLLHNKLGLYIMR
jgi:hypothetical protein